MPKTPYSIYEARGGSPVLPYTPSIILNSPQTLDIIADAIETVISIGGNFSSYPAAVRNTALDTTYDCLLLGNDGLPKGIIPLAVAIEGTWHNKHIVAELFELAITNPGSIVLGKLFSSSGIIPITLSIVQADITLDSSKSNWIKWSNIGSLDFTIWKDNIAGERPLDWKGYTYSIKKLGSKVVVYGGGGVSFLMPSNNVFGLQTIDKVGLKGKHSVCGTDSEHYFIDRVGRLYSLTDSLSLLDYREYLSLLTSSTVMSFDKINRIIYICDGIRGFVYSIDNKSLGEGPINVTGIDSQNGVFYVLASSTISNPMFEICTDIYDLGSRKSKTINSVELGTDTTNDLFVSIDYRHDKSQPFKTLPWHKVSPNGVTTLPCYGVEFRIRIKKTTYNYFELDYIRINGIVHNYIFQYPFVGR